jgi:undecaprenyl-diphosphatase
MYAADRLSRLKKDLGDISLWDSLIVGVAQAVALVPGTSRSGITMSAALARNVNRESAARFSFLLSTPALVGAAAMATWDLVERGGIQPDMRPAFVVGVLLSAVTGWIVIAFFLRFLRTHTLRFFVYYRVIFGIMILALAILARRSA